jgi:hypothetical protein
MKTTGLVLFCTLAAAGCGAAPDASGSNGGASEPTEEATSIADRVLKETANGPIDVTVIYRGANNTAQSKIEHYSAAEYAALVRARAAERAQRLAPAPQGELGHVEQAISVASCSNSSALWLYTGNGQINLALCLIDTGSYLVPGNSIMYHSIGAAWPGKDWGSLWGGSFHCSEEFSFHAWGPYTTAMWLPNFNSVELNTYYCYGT